MRFTAMANIFLLEDDKILSKGISIALKKDEHTVTAVYGYLEALQQYQKQKYDLFLLDINLPDGNGLEFCKKIRETSETPVLFLTANDTEEDMLEGFGVGCDDYISKPFSIEVLRKKVLAVLKRTGIGKFRMKYRDLELDKEKCVVLMKGQEIHLTSTEYKLLLYLMENRGRVVTKAMLLEQLWDIDGNFVDDNTVTNVLDNAVKYTPSGGVVDLKITEYPSYLRLDVSDNGIGIPEEEQAKIFGRFYRGKQSAGVDGVGIGLYLTRDIVNKQNGYIKVASDEKGTTFSLFLKKFREQ